MLYPHPYTPNPPNPKPVPETAIQNAHAETPSEGVRVEVDGSIGSKVLQSTG